MHPHDAHVEDVGRFYDDHAEAFRRAFGDVLQALRTADISRLLDAQAKAMDLRPGLKALDAGCGVCGPAIYFAQTFAVQIDAVTASAVQVDVAAQRIEAAGLADRVSVRQADFHDLAGILPAGSYDLVYFLESFGHSLSKARAMRSAWEMLRPGGRLYIKDLFAREPLRDVHGPSIDQNIRDLNRAFRYEVCDLYDVLRQLRRLGFILSSLRIVDVPLEDVDALTRIVTDFQNLSPIYRIEDLLAYVFPVDFFEVLCIKPFAGLDEPGNRYFLQNLFYHLQSENAAECESPS